MIDAATPITADRVRTCVETYFRRQQEDGEVAEAPDLAGDPELSAAVLCSVEAVDVLLHLQEELGVEVPDDFHLLKTGTGEGRTLSSLAAALSDLPKSKCSGGDGA